MTSSSNKLYRFIILSCCFPEHSVIKFPETSFLDSAAYMNEDETTERIGWYGDIMNGRRANDVFKVKSSS